MINAENVLESTVLRCVRTSTSMQSRLDRVHTILSRTTETNRVRNALRGYWLSRLHTQALIDRDREQTPKSKMIAHSRKAVDEDGRLCFVFFFYTSLLPIKTDYLNITNKNRLFHTLLFCEKQHSAALAHLLHPRSPAKPSSLHWSSSYQPFAQAVRTRGLTCVIQRSF